jgi:hypothetical protein
MSNLPTDFAHITLTDASGDKVWCKFVKEKADSEWSVAGKPSSRKRLQRDVELLRPGQNLPTRAGHSPAYRLKDLADGRQRIDVPGPPLPWEELPPVLDRLHAEFGNMRLTDDQLRACI